MDVFAAVYMGEAVISTKLSFVPPNARADIAARAGHRLRCIYDDPEN